MKVMSIAPIMVTGYNKQRQQNITPNSRWENNPETTMISFGISLNSVLNKNPKPLELLKKAKTECIEFIDKYLTVETEKLTEKFNNSDVDLGKYFKNIKDNIKEADKMAEQKNKANGKKRLPLEETLRGGVDGEYYNRPYDSLEQVIEQELRSGHNIREHQVSVAKYQGVVLESYYPQFTIKQKEIYDEFTTKFKEASEEASNYEKKVQKHKQQVKELNTKVEEAKGLLEKKFARVQQDLTSENVQDAIQQLKNGSWNSKLKSP